MKAGVAWSKAAQGLFILGPHQEAKVDFTINANPKLPTSVSYTPVPEAPQPSPRRG